MHTSWFAPDWPTPATVKAAVTTRQGGFSRGPYASFNLASHVSDDTGHVMENRRLLRRLLDLPAEPVWLEQVHGNQVVRADQPEGLGADAGITDRAGVVCAVLTADCLPVLFCDRAGTCVAAAHAGWRGLAAGILENTIAALAQTGAKPSDLMAWLGPAIGPEDFEVGGEVLRAFDHLGNRTQAAFTPAARDKWHADIYALARLALERGGVTAIHGGGLSTYRDAERFYSYRREPVTGRMASLIWLTPTRGSGLQPRPAAYPSSPSVAVANRSHDVSA